jgi:NADPH:quinone reductase-like Zn-dependent oxidoreductase
VTAGKVKAHIAKTYPLEEAAQALAALEQAHPAGKIVLIVS